MHFYVTDLLIYEITLIKTEKLSKNAGILLLINIINSTSPMQNRKSSKLEEVVDEYIKCKELSISI